MNCERCKKQTDTFTCSFFNTQNICMDCSDEERAHPDFPKAREAEYQAVKAGDMNYPGIGLPADLIAKYQSR